MVQRPVGISIISILAALVGIGFFLLAAVAAAFSTAGSFMHDWLEAYAGTVVPNIGALWTALALAVAGIFAILGILYLVTAYGLWTGRGWARMLSIILLILDIILGLLTLPSGIVTIIIAGVLLWYFFTPSVKAFFGAGPAPQAPPPPPPP